MFKVTCVALSESVRLERCEMRMMKNHFFLIFLVLFFVGPTLVLVAKTSLAFAGFSLPRAFPPMAQTKAEIETTGTSLNAVGVDESSEGHEPQSYYESEADLWDFLEDDEVMSEFREQLVQSFPFLLDENLNHLEVLTFRLLIKVWDGLSDDHFKNKLTSLRRIPWDSYPKTLVGTPLLSDKISESMAKRRDYLKRFVFDFHYGLFSRGYFSYSNYYTKIPSAKVWLYVFLAEELDLLEELPSSFREEIAGRFEGFISQSDKKDLKALMQRELTYYAYNSELLGPRDVLTKASKMLTIDQLKIVLDTLIQRHPLELMERIQIFSRSHKRSRTLSEQDAALHFLTLKSASEDFRSRLRAPWRAFREIFSAQLYRAVEDLGVEKAGDFLLHVYFVKVLRIQNTTDQYLGSLYEGAHSMAVKKAEELLLEELSYYEESAYSQYRLQKIRSNR